MSEMSVLSHEYQTSSNLSKAMNEALVTVKRTRLGLPGAEDVIPSELEDSRHYLADLLTTIMDLLSRANVDVQERGQQEMLPLVPGALISQLRIGKQGELPYYLEDLGRAATHLRARVEALTDDDLALLDELTATVDAQASRVFRRLMRT